jgi:uncharacterized protein (TIGR02391 family)
MVYSKSQLKKMFLKVLYEVQYGKMKGHSRGIDSIVNSWMNKYYGIKMSREEIQLTMEAIQELKISGLIVKDATQASDVFQLLTAKGKEIVEKQRDPEIYDLQLEQIIKNDRLLSKCLSNFNDDDFETAIFSAYKLVEEEVREKAMLGADDYGVVLMTKALHPDNGKLKIPTCHLSQEQEGVYNLFKGSIAFFKNPSSHRTVNYDDRMITMEIITLAELLLQILSTAVMRS